MNRYKRWLLLIVAAALVAMAGAQWRARQTNLSAEGFVSGLPALRGELKLSVAVLDYVETAAGESRKALWGVDLGTTKASVSAPVRVRYGVDLSGRGVDLRYDRESGTVRVTFPDPEVLSVELRLDEKRSLVQTGWARAEAFSGRALTGELERGLYAAAWNRSSGRGMLNSVKRAARPELERLVRDYANRCGVERARVSIRFPSDAVEPRFVAVIDGRSPYIN